MLIAVSSTGKNLGSIVSPSFGRSPYFIFVEVEGNEIKNYQASINPATQAFRGAGIAAAQAVVSKNPQVVITGNVGPNSFQVLLQTKVKIYTAPSVSVREAVGMYLRGELQEIRAPVGFGRGWGGGWGRGFGRGQGRGWGRGW